MADFVHGKGDIRIQNVGAEIGETNIGSERHLVLVAEGYVADGDSTSGDPNVAYELSPPANAPIEAGSLFGDGSPLDIAVTEAYRQNAVPSGVTAISPPTVSVTGEDPEGNGGTLLNYPIVEELDRITVDDGTGTELTARFAYEHDPSAPAGSDPADVAINPLRGEVAGLPSGGTVDYEYVDYDSTFNHPEFLESVYVDEQAEVMVPIDSETVGLALAPAIETMQKEYRGAMGYVGAEPNMTDDDGRPRIDADRGSDTAYTDSIDHDYVGLYGPSRLDWDPSASGGWRTALPGVAGKIAGNDLTDPAYHDDLRGYGDLEQNLRGDELDYLREQQVMPLTVVRRRSPRQSIVGGATTRSFDGSNQNVRIKGNVMSGTGSDYRRTQQSIRVLNAWTLNVHVECEFLLGRLTAEQFLDEVEAVLRRDWQEFVRRGIVQETTGGIAAGGDGEDQQNDQAARAGERDGDEAFFIELEATGDGRVEVGTGIAPTDVTETIKVTNRVGSPGEVSSLSGQATTQLQAD
jgi:hypothetical protein